jgi:hypothetical protein
VPVRVRFAERTLAHGDNDAIPAGDYVLIAETVDHEPALSDSSPTVGDTVRRALRVGCNRIDERYEYQQRDGRQAGNTCFRPGEQAASSTDIGALTTTYLLRGRQLLLVSSRRYIDMARSTVVGTYQRIEEYVPVEAAAEQAAPAAAPEPEPAAVERDARCPAALPEAGAACSTQAGPLECEYGPADRRCTRFAQCAQGADGDYSFRRDEEAACRGDNDEACPNSFDEAEQLAHMLADAEPKPRPACRYEQGVCGCSSRGATCRWRCRAFALDDCPWPRPLAGDGCTKSRECRYDDLCAPGLSLGPDMECRNGVWLQSSLLPISCRLAGAQ